jgi:hypothetical protein
MTSSLICNSKSRHGGQQNDQKFFLTCSRNEKQRETKSASASQQCVILLNQNTNRKAVKARVLPPRARKLGTEPECRYQLNSEKAQTVCVVIGETATGNQKRRCVCHHNVQSCAGSWPADHRFFSSHSKQALDAPPPFCRNLTRFASFLQDLAARRQTMAP